MIAGFSCLQRIGKGANARAWVPEPFLDTTVEWAAVREFHLLQEADNLAIDDLEINDLKRTFQALQRMRAGGYCVTTIALGRYAADSAKDDLEILDAKLREEITRMVHFLYLGEQSDAICARIDRTLDADTWRCADALPGIARMIGERRLFKPQKETAAEACFFEILERLPTRHIVHDVAVGLALPDATKEKNWTYIAKGEHAPMAFFGAIGSTIGERITHHMRGYGNRLTPHDAAWQRRAAHTAT